MEKSQFRYQSKYPSANLLQRVVSLTGEIVCETLWPTRCAICDSPGEVLCETCKRSLSYMDIYKACPRCGSPYGFFQCDLCNSVMLKRMQREDLPFDGCSSVTQFDEYSGQVIRTYKDAGEQRLAAEIALLMRRYIRPSWNLTAVTFIPASRAAYRRRGFDHGELLAQELGRLIDLPVIGLLERPRTHDQRAFGARERLANLSQSFQIKHDLSLSVGIESLLLIDDVFTTGATLCAASDALRLLSHSLYGLTFARV